jgi:hypothetical protein
MKRLIVLLYALLVVLGYGTALAEPPSNVPPTPINIATTLKNIPPAWSSTLQCDTTACPRFEKVMNETAVLDHETGLVWEQSPRTNTNNWLAAQLNCNLLALGGRLGWRVPTIQELASLVDPTVAVPGPVLSDGHPFSNVQSSAYWSATTAVNTAFAWYVFFSSGGVNRGDKTNNFYVWCVRGGHGVDPQ